MRLGLLVGLLFVAMACSSESSSPRSSAALGGYFCGGIAGASCPPASTCEGTCDEPDCTTPCVPTQACATSATCPNGYVCGAASKCVPEKMCSANADCPSGKLCARGQTSNGMCLTVPTTAPTTCKLTSDCPFPWICMGDRGCGLRCLGGACPSGMTCTADTCS